MSNLTKRGEDFCRLLESIIQIETTDQLQHLLDWLKTTQQTVWTDDVREEISQISAKLSAQEALVKALFALTPKNSGKGTSISLRK